MLPFGMVETGVKPIAPFLPLRQMLDEDAAGDMAGVVDGEAHEARYLLGLAEEALRGLGERIALQRHDALVALAATRVIEGDGYIALAEPGQQRAERGHVGHT